MSKTLISLDSISLSTPSKNLFSEFTATIHTGNRIALIGRNGSGKTTLLQNLAAHQQPTNGTITYAPGITIGLLPQTMRLDQSKTVWEVATQHVGTKLALLAQFEQCNAGEITLLPDEYDTTLSTLTEQNIFDLPAQITTMLSHFSLHKKKDDLVATLSGGQQILLGLIRLMAQQPELLLLDEPTNNLGKHHREQLIKLLVAYRSTIVIVSHDIQLLTQLPHIIWHIKQQHVQVFNGTYQAFLTKEAHTKQQTLLQKNQLLSKKKALVRKAEQEQRRVAESQKKGTKKYGNDRNAVGAAKERASKTASKTKGALNDQKEDLNSKLKTIFIPDVIKPTFTLSASTHQNAGIYVQDGSVGYNQTPILTNISLAIARGERIAITGRNGSGKSTLLKALLSNTQVTRTGQWQLPRRENIGDLDQHYTLIERYKNAVDTIKTAQETWTEKEVRAHLSTFLFRTHEEVLTPTNALSGGEKARLCLALIAAQSPSVLLLDEITNNIDLHTRQHCIEVLNKFPGTIIAVSHDDDFLKAIGCEERYQL